MRTEPGDIIAAVEAITARAATDRPATQTDETILTRDHSHDGNHHEHEHEVTPIDWRENGVKVIPGNPLDPNTAQTPGMDRAAAINFARVGAQKIWAGTVTIHANAKTGAHHHGDLESVIYVVKGTRAHALGRAAWNMSPKPARATSSTCRPTCRTRRSTPAPTRRSNACLSAAARSRWSSTWTSSRSRSPSRCCGSIPFTDDSEPAFGAGRG